jgi:hypothetical protein
MSIDPFGSPQHGPRESTFGRTLQQPAALVFVVCFTLGLVAVAWRTKVRVHQAEAQARVRAQAVAAAVELQFSQVLAAVEALGTWAQQSGGSMPGFPAVAGELLANHPGLASLELAPAGVVGQIVPRTGNERAPGFNFFKDPPRRIGANIAIQKRALTIAGPLRLYNGEPGVSAMIPIHVRERDGRETFWGFVAGSMRLSETMARARVGELLSKEYAYRIASRQPNQQSAFVIAEEGHVTAGALEQAIRAHNLTFALSLQPRMGWLDKTVLALELLALLLVSSLLSAVTALWNAQRSLQSASAASARQLAHETEARKRADEELRFEKDRALSAQKELKQTRAEREKAQADLAEVKTRFEEVDESARGFKEAAEARQRQADSRAGELEIRLDGEIRAAHDAKQQRERELEQARAALGQARQNAVELQARLDAAMQRETEVALSADRRFREAQAAIVDLQTKLDSAVVRANEASGAGAAKLNEAAAQNRDLKGCLDAAERQIKELTEQLREHHAVAKHAGQSPSVEGTASANELSATGPDTTVDPRTQRAGPAAPPLSSPAPPAGLSGGRLGVEPGEGQASAARGSEVPKIALEKTVTDRQEAELDLEEEDRANSPEASDARKEPELRARRKPEKTAKPPGKPPQESQLSLFGEAKAVDLAELRKAVHEIVPLLADQDPGAKDCLKANRAAFRATFTSDAGADFERLVMSGSFAVALDQLKKAVRKHGIAV